MLAPMAVLVFLCLTVAVVPQDGRGLARRGLGPGPRRGSRSSVPGDGTLRRPRSATLGYVNAWTLIALGTAAAVLLALSREDGTSREGPTWGCGYVMPTVRMQYTGRSFAEMIAEHLLPRFLRPRTTRQAPARLFPPGSEFGSPAPTRSAKGCTSRSSGAGRIAFPGFAFSNRGRSTSIWYTWCSRSCWPWPGCPFAGDEVRS